MPNAMSSILAMKSNRLAAGSSIEIADLTTRMGYAESDISGIDGRLGTVESKIGAGLTTSITVMINATPTYSTLTFTNGILTSVV